MIRIPIDIRGIGVWRDLRANRWTIEDQQHTYTLQEWNWGLRHQLARSAVVAGQFDRELFIDNLFAVLVDSQPATDRIRLAYTVLHLLNVPEQTHPVSLARAEMLLAQSYGWRPDDLREHSVASLDDMVQILAEQDRQRSAHQHNDGWKSIVFTQPDSSITDTSNHAISTNDASMAHDLNTDVVLHARLRNMLDAVAFWAGLVPDTELETTEDEFVRQQPQSIKGELSKQVGPEAVNVSDEINGLPEHPATFFKGMARLQPSSRSTRHDENISSVSHVNHPGDVDSDKSGLQQNHVTTPRKERVMNPGNSLSGRGAIKSNFDDSEPMVVAHKRNAIENPTPAPAASMQPRNDGFGSATPSHLTANTTWPAAGNKTVGRIIGVNGSAHAPVSRNEAWQPLHGNLPSRTECKPPALIDPAIDTTLANESAGLAAAALLRENEWPPDMDMPKILVAANEETLPSEPGSIAMVQLDTIKANPFALSELEEQLADALERAAREAGIDIP